jgi:hypothetical protein
MIAPRKRQQVIAELQANPNAYQVMLKVGGISYSSVRRIARAADIDLALRHRRPSTRRDAHTIEAAKRARIIAELRKNPNAHQVMRAVGGVSYGSVWLIAKAAGIDLIVGRDVKRKPKITVEKRAQIVAALRADPNARKVARLIGGISNVSVWAIAKTEGIALARGRSEKLHRNARMENRDSSSAGDCPPKS